MKWLTWEEDILRLICEEAKRQGLRSVDAAVTAAARLQRGIPACLSRIRKLKLMARPYYGMAREQRERPGPGPVDGVEQTAWGKPLSFFQPEGGGK